MISENVEKNVHRCQVRPSKALNLLQHVFHGVTSSLPRVDFRSGCPSGSTWLFHNLQVIKKKIGKIPLVFIKLNKFNITFVPYSTVCLISQFPVS